MLAYLEGFAGRIDARLDAATAGLPPDQALVALARHVAGQVSTGPTAAARSATTCARPATRGRPRAGSRSPRCAGCGGGSSGSGRGSDIDEPDGAGRADVGGLRGGVRRGAVPRAGAGRRLGGGVRARTWSPDGHVGGRSYRGT